MPLHEGTHVSILFDFFFQTSVDDAASARGAGGSFGVSVSTLSNNEARIEDSAKTIFDWVMITR